jgi:hypothetical protein
MEGVELHPWRDDAGVHRFDPAEVTQAARAPRQRFSVPSEHTPAVTAETVLELEQLLTEAEDRIRSLEHLLTVAKKEARDAQSAAAGENDELHTALDISLACIIEHLGPDTPSEVVDLLERLIVYYSKRR